jgi:hypothetical protein
MKIIIETNDPESIEKIIAFSKRCADSTDGNVDYLDVVREEFCARTGCFAEDLKIYQQE